MNPRYGDAPVSPAQTLTALLSGNPTAVLPRKMMGVRALLQNSIVTGALALALCLLALLGAAGSAQALVAGEDFETGQVVVKLNPTSGSAIEEINADYGLTTLDDTLGSTGIYLLKAPAGSDTEKVVERLKNDPRLLFAEPNFVAEAPEDPAADNRHTAWGISDINGSSEQYATAMLNLPCAAALSLGQNTTVAVVDTGAQLDHPQLAPNFEGVARYDFVDKDRNPTERAVGLDADGDGLKDELVGHGTHVAGIVDLVAPSAKIMPLRVLDSEGRGNTFTIAKAISYAQSEGANVINLSLGSSSRSAALQEVIKDAIESGVVVAAAAGNSDSPIPHYPAAGNGTAASADGLVAVTSVDMYDKKSDFANYGIWVDIAAPGNGIRSTFPISMYANWSGTSMATPFISGQAALIHAVYGSLNPAGVEKQIRNNAKPLTVDNPTYVGMLGAGRADLCACFGGL
jgi:subtilisin family serine protease